MDNKLIFKVGFDKQTKDAIKIDTNIDNWRADFKDPFGEVMDWVIRSCCYDYESKKLKGDYDKLGFLKTLIVAYGFKLTLKQVERIYRLVIYKNTSSISFETSKENKIETLLLQAEEWAKDMLEELNSSNNI